MIIDNLKNVQDRIADACARANRSPADVTLVAVSKTHPVDTILEAAVAGVQHFGENRVEEANQKIPEVNQRVANPLTWHMIGHIQSRKAKNILPHFQVVHSIDSLRLAEKMSKLVVEQGKTLDILLEMNISGEVNKEGFAACGWMTNREIRDRLWDEVRLILALPGMYVRGLMTMAPIVADAEYARPVFADLAALRAALTESFGITLPDLSMGMTDDYPVAIEEGATIVRIGRAIFGEREK